MVTAFRHTIDEVMRDFQRFQAGFQPVTQCQTFSPHAYNSLSFTILLSLLDCIKKMDDMSEDVTYNYNMGLLMFTDLQRDLCLHYFTEYERINGLVDSRYGSYNGKNRYESPLIPRIFKSLRRMKQVIALSLCRLDGKKRIAVLGSLPINWIDIAPRLLKEGIMLERLRVKERINVPFLNDQMHILKECTRNIHCQLSTELDVAQRSLKPFRYENIDKRVKTVLSVRLPLEYNYDIFLTGSLSHTQPRVVALQAQVRGIPLIMFHHGGHYLIFDEPLYEFFEGMLPNAKIIYGSVDSQKNFGTLGRDRNLVGDKIVLISRSDKKAVRLFNDDEIEPASYSLSNAKILYIATHCDGRRHGPFRDVHPAIYLKWQEALLAWVEKLTGVRPFLRLHPSRGSTRYDPLGYDTLAGDIEHVLNMTDIYIMDYPTTTFAYITATNKPVMFFDIALRNIHPSALLLIRERCHYASVDILDPRTGFKKMESDLSRKCIHSFSHVFTFAEDNTDEFKAVKEAIARLSNNQN